MKFISKENYFDRSLVSHMYYKLHMNQTSELCRKWHIALIYLRYLGVWLAHDGAKKNLERWMSASGMNTSHQYSFQGSKDLFKQILFKTYAFV